MKSKWKKRTVEAANAEATESEDEFMN